MFCSRRRCRCIITCKNYKQQEWEIPRNGRNVQSAVKLCTTGLRGTDTCAYILVNKSSIFFFTIFTWLCRHWLCNIYKKISFFLSLPLFQVKNPILVAFAVDVSEPITTSSATRRNVRIDTPGLSCNPPPRTARAWCPAWSTDNGPSSTPPH